MRSSSSSGGPFRWILCRKVVQTPSDFPLPVAMAGLEDTRDATLMRASHLMLRSTRLEALDLCALVGRDCEPLAHPLGRWRRDALASVLHRAMEAVAEDPFLAWRTSQRACARQVPRSRLCWQTRSCAPALRSGLWVTVVRHSRAHCLAWRAMRCLASVASPVVVH